MYSVKIEFAWNEKSSLKLTSKYSTSTFCVIICGLKPPKLFSFTGLLRMILGPKTSAMFCTFMRFCAAMSMTLSRWRSRCRSVSRWAMGIFLRSSCMNTNRLDLSCMLNALRKCWCKPNGIRGSSSSRKKDFSAPHNTCMSKSLKLCLPFKFKNQILKFSKLANFNRDFKFYEKMSFSTFYIESKSPNKS